MLLQRSNFFSKRIYPFISGPKLGWGLSVLYILSAVFSVIHFQVWGQVLWFWERDMPFNPTNVFMYKNEFRYYLLLPLLKLCLLLNVDYDWLFSILVTAYLLLAAYLVTRFAIGLGIRKNYFWPLFNTNAIFFILLSLFMNGRLASGFAGIAMIQLALLYKFNGCIHNAFFLPVVILGIWFCSISSGVFLVANLTLFFGLALYFLGRFKSRHLSLGDMALGSAYLLTFYFLILILLTDINMELKYFNYSLTHMLSHGFGIIFWKHGFSGIGVLGVLGGLCLFSLHFVWNRYQSFRILFIPVLFSLALGLFGYSTLLTGLPAALCLSEIVLLHWLQQQGSPRSRFTTSLTIHRQS